MTPVDGRQYYFIHVMKTAGGTFKRHIARNFDRDDCYPPEVAPDDRSDIYLSTEHLQTLSADERRQIKVVTGHYPFAAKYLLADDVVTFTLLRDPIERTVSHIKLIQRADPKFADHTLTEVYDDPFSRAFFFTNYQARVFAYDDPTNPTAMADLELDDDRLAIAKANLASVDVFGFREQIDEFLAEVAARYDWRIDRSVKDKNIAPAVAVDPELRARVEADNQIDIEFYEWSQQLYEERQT